ncbi:MAG: hypothetical protein LUD52_04820 [Opitutae bacterium]|nr:hypothetical protein [Opitutae bacterium]
MDKNTPLLTWCEIRFGKDMNWWVRETSVPVQWDDDSLPIIDPRQMSYILDLLDGLREYGLSTEIVENAFIPFQLQKINPDKTARLVRVNETFFDTDEELFAMPDIIDDSKTTYADFLSHITKLRVNYLNDKIDFVQKFTTTELEEQIRDAQTQAFMEGRTTHAFQEIIDILEFIPDGFELSLDDEDEKLKTRSEEDDFKAAKDIDEFEEKGIVEDDTMRWDDEESDEAGQDDDQPPPKKRRGRKPKKQ